MLPNFNAQNERLKHQYLRVCQHSRGYSQASLDQMARSILEFEKLTGFKAFADYDEEVAIAYKDKLRSRKTKAGQPISAASVRTHLLNVKRLFEWIADSGTAGIKINRDQIGFLNPSKAEIAMANSSITEKVVPTLAQCKHLLQVLPKKTPLQRRTRAILTLLTLSACRVTALSGLKIKHLDAQRWVLKLNAKELATKGSKSFVTPLFPVGQVFYDELSDWLAYLQGTLLFGPSAPLFPKSVMVATKDKGFQNAGLSSCEGLSSATIRTVVGDMFESNGLARTSPHRFRDMIIAQSSAWNLSNEQLRVLSQSLGHSDLSTTLTYYGVPTQDQQIAVMDAMRAELNQ